MNIPSVRRPRRSRSKGSTRVAYAGFCTAARAGGVPSAGAIEVLTQLRDKSLLLAREGTDGDLRLDMYRGVRTFAAARLSEMGPARAAAESKHAAYFASFLPPWTAARVRWDRRPNHRLHARIRRGAEPGL